ncbi:alpha-ribazole phosphatase [Clostridium sp. SYSU_GA19001]|uniref:alpha-ribazole phosphatase n=1 Tax=Clostridium caldaquaticum TaxID=2940653 RepID=UPI0020772762|nr:alpha-ribazole phosphatase [Clostridium caldaquaticum]MCM8710060.1 alpha-ribazole phosphatase [Clostridium caldaquaticum]
MNIYLLRHGETEGNKNKFYYGKLNMSLNENGKTQAKNAGILLKNINFKNIYISERKRTRETAEIVLGRTEGFIIDSRINEINFGEFEGRSYEEIQKKFPIEYEKWSSNWKEFVPPGGESYIQFYSRVRNFMKELLETGEEDVLVVTHGGVIRAVYCYVLDNNLDFYWKFSSENGDLSIIKYEYGNLFIDSITHAGKLKEYMEGQVWRIEK